MYGRRTMTRYLRRRGHDVAFCTVDRLMREPGLNGVVRGRRQRTTIPAKDGVRAADRLDRDFTATAPNLVWVADFTYRSAPATAESAAGNRWYSPSVGVFEYQPFRCRCCPCSVRPRQDSNLREW
jgi:transposase InsO family protein